MLANLPLNNLRANINKHKWDNKKGCFVRRRRGTLERIRNIAISALVLLLFFVGAGIAYVLVSGGQNGAKTEQIPTAPSPDTGIIKPHQPAPNAPESAGLESVFTPVKIGQNTSMTVKTLPGSTCSITFTYNNVAGKDSGLVAKKADEYGSVSWSWTIGSSVPVGKWPAKVTCVHNKKSAVVVGNIEVTR